MAQKRHWCFTLNNYTNEDLLIVRNLDCKYVCFQPERGEAGTPHLQGFVSFRNGRLLAGVRLLFTRADGTCGIHLEPMRGTAEQAIKYCSKEDSRDPGAGFVFEEYGDRPRVGTGASGNRSDLMEVAGAIRDGKNARDIFDDYGESYIKFYKGIASAISLVLPARNFKTEVFWFHGPTGTGKSRKAFEDNPDAYWKSTEHSWWDGYIGQEVVIIDDYRCDFCKFSNLLRLLDRYPYQVQIKGGTVNFIAKKIYITAPKSPSAMWEHRTEEDLQQLLRRIEHVTFFPGFFPPVN